MGVSYNLGQVLICVICMVGPYELQNQVEYRHWLVVVDILQRENALLTNRNSSIPIPKILVVRDNLCDFRENPKICGSH